MTLWKESTNVLPADGATVWTRRFPGIEHPKQAAFSTADPAAPVFTLTVNAPDTGHPVTLIIPAAQIHSWRPVTGPSPGPGGCAAQEAAGNPLGVAIPAFVGQLYHDSAADSYYRSTALTTADWTLIAGGTTVTTDPPGLEDQVGISLIHPVPSLTALTWSAAASASDLDVLSPTYLQEIHLPNLTSIHTLQVIVSDALTTLDAPLLTNVLGDVIVEYNAALTTVNMPALVSVAGNLSLTGSTALITLSLDSLLTVTGQMLLNPMPALTTLSLPWLTTTGTGLQIANAPSLVSLSLPSWIPTDGTGISFYDNAFDIPTIEAILAQCVAAAVTTCSIDLSGGTNAGLASLSPTAQANAAALGAQLTINP